MYGVLSVRLRTAQALLVVVVEILAAEGSLAQVLAEVRGVGAAAAVADDEDEAPLLITFENGIGEDLHLARINAEQFLPGPFQKFANSHRRAQSSRRLPIRITIC